MIMNTFQLTTIGISLLGLIGIGSPNKHDYKSADPKDGSVPAITRASAELPLDKIKMPAGFTISVYAEVPGARSMVMSTSGTLFVGTQRYSTDKL